MNPASIANKKADNSLSELHALPTRQSALAQMKRALFILTMALVTTRLIERHGGQISASSAKGQQGADFQLALPIRQAHPPRGVYRRHVRTGSEGDIAASFAATQLFCRPAREAWPGFQRRLP